MSRRVFVRVRRGPMDNTAVCVFPWEMPILQLVHMQEVTEVSIDEMATQREGVVKVEKLKLKHTDKPAPDLRSQLEIMAYVDPDEDPVNDPASEYERLVNKYGMDKDLPIPCVTRIYGEYAEGGAFAAALEKHAKNRLPKPAALKAMDEGLGKAPDQMSIAELRAALKERGIEWKVTDTKVALVAKLEEVLVT
ncbi:MAG: hypothetical protein EPO20_14890 [Betaproteobacteria bacterium]|nr:MAG: hypothetical protein EPO20_14890 [Betaproteobacteria bacterium]